MAFDQTTRNRLQRFVNDARRVLEEEFTRQLQNDYGMDPNAGAVTDLASLRHINDAQRETARIVRDTLAHYTASGDMNAAQGLDRIVREQAFTVLNRLAALRMAEARGLLVESVGNGFQAKGFQLYARLAGTGLGETGDAYRVYLFSVFDELAQDLPGLFDRYSPQGRLFPREAALLQVLNLINDADIAPLWGQDETIGWIYQYFNSKEERKAMREASQAPRNSRELAVRNQFFTPRYVVEFLVDNTLGRLWYEATQGTTALRDRCQYLLCTPQDVFLRRFDTDDLRPGSVAALVQAGRWSDLPTFDTTETGVQAMIEFAHCVNTYDRYANDTWGDYFQRLEPALREQRFADLSTQELWDGIFLVCRADRHGGDGSVYQERWFVAACQEIAQRLKSDEPQRKAKVIAHHPVRDPRTLKLLDPACGSMHFGLYAFDLFAEIYREAWAWEQQHGPGSLQVPADAARTSEYASKTALAQAGQSQAAIDTEASKAAPGVYAPLCQAYADEAAFLRDVPRLVIEHNIYGVDIDPRAAQIASLALWLRAQRAWHDMGVKSKNRPLIGRGHVIAAIAPPAERELRLQFAASLDKRDADLFEKTLQLLKGLPEFGVLLQVERELQRLIREVYVGKGAGLFASEEQANWQQAENRLRVALSEFSHAARSTYQGRLFAQDALQGLRLIDLCREIFDVIVMNPPFGQISKGNFEYLKSNYPDSYIDIYTCFVSRAVQLCKGRVGAISSRSFLITKRLERFRENCALPRIDLILDLGWPVMDDATVQSAAFTLDCTDSEPSSNITAIDRRSYVQKDKNLTLNHGLEGIENTFSVLRDKIKKLSRFRILYNLPEFAFNLFIDRKSIGENILIAKTGMKSFQDVRFLRARHEVPPIGIGKGRKWVPLAKGGPYAAFYSDLPLVVNWENDGGEICANAIAVHGQIWQARQASVHYYKCGGTYSRRSKDFAVRVLPSEFIIGEKGPAILPVGNYDPLFVVGLMNARLFRAIVNFQANAKQFDTGLVEACPYSDFSNAEQEAIKMATVKAVDGLRRIAQGYEEDSHFISPQIAATFNLTVEAYASHDHEKNEIVESSRKIIDGVVDSNYGVDSVRLGEVLLSEANSAPEEDAIEAEADEEGDAIISTSPREIGFRLLSYAFGAAIGRWDIGQAALSKVRPSLGSCLAPIPQYVPGLLRHDANNYEEDAYPLKLPTSGILADDEIAEFDVEGRIREAIKVWLGPLADDFENEIVASLKVDSIREYLRNSNGFFSDHIALYTRSKRKAPIYWPLSTISGSYTLWVYYPSLSSQTLYSAVNDFIEPKLQHISANVTALRNKGTARTREDEKQFEAQQAFEVELIDLRDVLLEIAPSYNPNFDDGVQVSAAPLWSLFRNKPWQKVLKDTWSKLEKGDYDWAHLAMNYWPERVREKCKTDKSLAIAHGLENLYVEPEAAPKKTRGRKKAGVGE